MNVILTLEAERDLAEIDEWWRERRRDAPDKFANEFVGVRRDIARMPHVK